MSSEAHPHEFPPSDSRQVVSSVVIAGLLTMATGLAIGLQSGGLGGPGPAPASYGPTVRVSAYIQAGPLEKLTPAPGADITIFSPVPDQMSASPT